MAKRLYILTGVAALFAAVTAPAMSETLPTRHVLTLDIARRIVVAAEAEARRQNQPAVIAVVDAEGLLIALDRMDGAMFASVSLAPGKAKAAASFNRPSKALEDAIHDGRIALTTSGFVTMGGGVPLVLNGEEVGAIGVSTPKPDADLKIAAVGAAALSK